MEMHSLINCFFFLYRRKIWKVSRSGRQLGHKPYVTSEAKKAQYIHIGVHKQRRFITKQNDPISIMIIKMFIFSTHILFLSVCLSVCLSVSVSVSLSLSLSLSFYMFVSFSVLLSVDLSF